MNTRTRWGLSILLTIIILLIYSTIEEPALWQQLIALSSILGNHLLVGGTNEH